MENRKKILLLFYRFPYPPFGGDTYKGYNMLVELSKYHDITLFCLTELDVKQAYQDEVNKYLKKLVIVKAGKFKSALLALRFLFNNKPIQSNYFYNQTAQYKINELLKEVDLVIPVTIRMQQYVQGAKKTVLFDAVDSIALNYKNAVHKVKNYFWKLIYYIEIPRVYRAELNAVQSSEHTFFVNHEEALYWSKYGDVVAIPNGVHHELLDFNPGKEKKDNSIVFFGKMDYQPNLDALAFLVEKVLPLLDEKIQIKVVGLDPQNLCAKKYNSNQGVNVLGFQDKPQDEISKSLAAVLPMQTGGGIQNKILQCMAIGQLVVTSTLGAKPIENAKNGEHLFIADNPQQYADLIHKLQANSDQFAQVGENARNLIKKAYSWKMYGEKLNHLIMNTEKK